MRLSDRGRRDRKYVATGLYRQRKILADAEREYALRPAVAFWPSRRGLYAGAANKWTVVDMTKDWNVIVPFEKR
jgi:hypothetical protein